MNKQQSHYELRTLTEMGKYAHITRNAICAAIKKGHLKAQRVGRLWCCNKAELDHYMANKFNTEEKRQINGEKVFDLAHGIFSVRVAHKYLTEKLGKSINIMTLYGYLHEGLIGGYKKGKSWVIPVQELEKYIAVYRRAEAEAEREVD